MTSPTPNDSSLKSPPKKRQPLLVRTAFLLVFLVVAAIGTQFDKRTPEQMRAAQQAREQQSAIREMKKIYCRELNVCRRYSSARQECAVAGDFNNCLDVKVGSTDLDYKDACTADGHFVETPENMPSDTECFILTLGGLSP